MKKILFSIFINLIVLQYAFAEGAGGAIALSLKEFFQPIFSLIFVIGLIYGAFFAYTKLNKYNIQKFSNLSKATFNKSKISLVYHLPLGQNKSVDVIEVDGQRLLLGVCADNISLIKELDKVGNTLQENNSDNNEEDLYTIKEAPEVQESENSKLTELYRKYLRNRDE